MRTLTNGTLTVLAYDATVWLQERNVLKVTDSGASEGDSVYLWEGHYSNVIAKFTLNANKKVTIDLTDYIRMKAKGIAIGERLSDLGVKNDSGDYVTADAIIGGLISTKYAIIPERTTVMTMEPPSVMYAPIADGLFALELCSDTHILASVCDAGGCSTFAVENGVPTIVSSQDTPVEVEISNSAGVIRRFSIKPLDDCRRYCAVRWKSFTGLTRSHTFEVRDANQATSETLKLQTQDGSYNQIKGRTDGLTLYLDGLNAYDYWYYGDLVTSSKVEVSMDGTNWYQVEVTTKSLKVPNTSEGKTNKLEVTINWRNYDAVTM